MKGIAKDGKPYDIEDGLTLNSNEVEVIQYLVPSGKRRTFYARRLNEPKENDKIMIATNDQGVNNTIPVLKKLIDVF